MIEYINDHTIRLTPGTPAKCGCPPGKNMENSLGREIRLAVKSAVRSQLEKQLWLERQIRRADEFQAALAEMGCKKGQGALSGWYCPPGPFKIMEKR